MVPDTRTAQSKKWEKLFATEHTSSITFSCSIKQVILVVLRTNFEESCSLTGFQPPFDGAKACHSKRCPFAFGFSLGKNGTIKKTGNK